MPSGGSDSECSLFMCVTKMALFSAHGLLLWRQSKIQVFQDDVREKKEKKGRILDLHRCQYTIFLLPSPSECSSLVTR